MGIALVGIVAGAEYRSELELRTDQEQGVIMLGGGQF